jgi:hypothetical protein
MLMGKVSAQAMFMEHGVLARGWSLFWFGFFYFLFFF